MGFADLSIADIAAQYDLQVEIPFRLCGLALRGSEADRLKISYKNEATCLALENAKMVILEILFAKTVRDDESQSDRDQTNRA